MSSLRKHFHAIVFSTLLLFAIALQCGPLSLGWPFLIKAPRMADWFQSAIVRSIVNAIPCMMVLSLCMQPFGYDDEKSFSLVSILMLSVSASITFVLVRSSIVSYQPYEQFMIGVLSVLAVNGIFAWTRKQLANFVHLPDFKKTDSPDDEEFSARNLFD